ASPKAGVSQAREARSFYLNERTLRDFSVKRARLRVRYPRGPHENTKEKAPPPGSAAGSPPRAMGEGAPPGALRPTRRPSPTTPPGSGLGSSAPPERAVPAHPLEAGTGAASTHTGDFSALDPTTLDS